MKNYFKFSLVLSFLFLVVPSSYAVLFNSTAWPKLKEFQTGPLGEITITAEENDEITLNKSLTFGLDPLLLAVFNVDITQISIAGTAVENNKIDSQITPIYSFDGKWITIPIKENLVAGETVIITGLQIRTYDANRGNYSLLLDLGFDEILDRIINYNISITEDNNRDTYAPYPISNITLEDGVISWENWPDLDKNYIEIEIAKNDSPVYTSQLPKNTTQYILTTHEIGDSFNIKLRMWDITGNSSNWTENSFIIKDDSVEDIKIIEETNTNEVNTSTDDLIKNNLPIVLVPKIEIKNKLANKFYDVDLNDDFIDYLSIVGEKVEINGYKANKRSIFGKDKNISRAELLKIVLDASGINTENNYQKPFSDIFLSFWGASYINKAKNLGIIAGYPDGNFYPDRNISVAESIKIILETFNLNKENIELTSDEIYLLENNNINAFQWYSPYFCVLLQYNLTDSLTNLKDDRKITREEIIKLVANILSLKLQ